MNSMPNHADFMELGTIHQHQSTCKQHCFVFTEIADIDLPPEITKYPEKIKNGSIHSYKKDSMSPPPPKVPKSRRSRKIIAVVSALLVCIALAAGIPLGLQLRSSSLLEARLAFIRRLLAESPLVEGYWAPQMGANFSKSYAEVKNSMVGALLWPISVPCAAQYLDAVQLTLEGIDDARRMVKKNKEMIIVESADAMEQAHTDGKMAILFGLEGGHTLGSSLAVLRSMYSLGARFVSLTGLGCTTPWASASIRTDFFDENLPSTLTNFGEVVIQEMNRLGMLVEISRLSEPAMMVALNIAKAPLLLSNALPSSMACNGSTAAIPDHIMSALSQNGGVIMLNVERCGDKPMNLKDAIAAINYVRAIAGVGHVGLSGSPKNYPLLLAELARDRLWGSAAIKKLVGGNIVRVLREVEINKNRLPLSEDWIPLEAVEGNAYCRYPET
ncbi:AAEL002547-PA [Aedes aegypti]|uniref:Dipeptidase n=1 Tax=Aedes aegypti TaxID=7159 RepID=Q17HT5_AEDAE|nr:AAEL002547-PA [Aedes aegypti]